MKTLLLATLMLSGQAFSATAANNMQPTQLDDLIRGEMTAIKTYSQVLEKVKDPAEMKQLTAIKQDHVNAVATLKRYATKDVLEDTTSTGPWGTFTEAFTGAAKMMGNTTAVKALTQGEEHGVTEYKEALADDNITPDLKKVIKATLLPKQEGHIKALKSFI